MFKTLGKYLTTLMSVPFSVFHENETEKLNISYLRKAAGKLERPELAKSVRRVCVCVCVASMALITTTDLCARPQNS